METGAEHLKNIELCKTHRHLVVDDEAATRLVIKALLHNTAPSLVVDEADDGKSALSCFGTAGVDAYDVIWTDFNMPGMNGLELAQELRRRGFRKYVVMVTGAGVSDVQLAEAESGIDLVCLKPLRMKALQALEVMQLVEEH
jgi:CheY-like chemotaxis protein